MDTKHTPGPWEMHQPEGCAGFYFDSGPVQFYVKRTSLAGADEMEANARIIAAAPALLAALDRLLARYDTPGGHSPGCQEYPPGCDDSKCCEIAQARAAIAAAKGEA